MATTTRRALGLRTNRRSVLGAGLGLSAAALAAACGSSSNSNSSSAKPANSSGSGPAAGAGAGSATSAPGSPAPNSAKAIIGNNWNAIDGTPKYGGTLNYAPGSPTLASLDPILSASAMVHQVVGNAYSRLVKIGRAPNDQNALVMFPDLATSWEVTDPTTLTFHLRTGVKFHNVAPVNGRDFAVDDVKYSINRAATDPTSQFRGDFNALDSVQTPDPQTVVLKLKRYDATLLRNIGGNSVWMVPHELVEGPGLKNAIVGTGPFIFDKWEQDTSVSFHKNPSYFLPGIPFVDQLSLLIIPDPTAQLTAFTSQQVIETNLGKTTLPQAKAAAPNIQTKQYTVVSPYVFFMNFQEPNFKDDRVRKAISLALDPDAVLKILNDGDGLWRGVVSHQVAGWGLSQDELKGNSLFMRHNVQDAKQLLAAAGFPNGFSTGLMYTTSYGQVYTSAAQYLQQGLADIGIKVDLNGLELATFRKNQDQHNYKGFIFGLDGEGQSEQYLVDYRSDGPKNGSGFSDPNIDAAIDAVTSITDDTQRLAKAQDLERTLLTNVYYKKAFVDTYALDAWHPWVKNLFSAPPHFYPTSELAYVWLEK